MTARDIQRRLMVERYRRSFVLYNYTPKTWFECDVFEITKAGFFREYEIKLSLSDFKADAEKQKTVWKYNTVNGRGAFDRTAGDNKHNSLRAAAPHGPSQFWFVCPMDLIPASECPDWAGLIYVREWKGHKPPYNVIEHEIKQAPRLHRQKATPEVEQHARGVCYYRLHNMFCHSQIVIENSTHEEKTKEIHSA